MALMKRGNIWWLCIRYKGKLIRRSTRTTNRRLAEKIHARVLTELIESDWLGRPFGEHITFKELLTRYEKDYLKDLPSGKTCSHYVRGLIDYFGNLTLKDITPELIHEFKKMRKSQGVKSSTINRQLTIAKRAVNIAIKEWGWNIDNPFSRVPMEKETPRDRWLTYEEEEALLRVSPQWLKDFIIFAIWTGLRESNIINLKREDVDLKRRVVYIRKTKNGNPLLLPLHDKAYEVLERRLRVAYLEHEYVFTSPTGKKIMANNLRRAFRKAVKKAGLKDLRIHDLRHTFGTRLAQSGVDLYTIAKLLGHRDIRATQRYAHHCVDSLRAGLENLHAHTLRTRTESLTKDLKHSV